MPRKTTAVAKSTRFEDALEELESLVRALESGEQSLEDSLGQFERGVALSRFCRRSLADAERQVKILLEGEDGEERLEEFESSSGGNPSSGAPAGDGPSDGTPPTDSAPAS